MPDVTDSDLISAQLSADAAWERAQDLEARVQRLMDENAEHRKRSMRQYYGSQGFMALKSALDYWENGVGRYEDADALLRHMREIITSHKTNMDRASNSGSSQTS